MLPFLLFCNHPMRIRFALRQPSISVARGINLTTFTDLIDKKVSSNLDQNYIHPKVSVGKLLSNLGGWIFWIGKRNYAFAFFD